MTNCPICNGNVEYTTKPVNYNYKNHSRTINQSGHYCSQCNESFLSPKDLKATKKEITDFQRSVDNLLTTDELKKIRKKFKLTQEDAALLFGGGIRAFHKYETAEATQSKPLDILLRLINNNKISLDDIKTVAV
jgi:HTH-type transcriptional regulator/antitoxin MqsA